METPLKQEFTASALKLSVLLSEVTDKGERVTRARLNELDLEWQNLRRLYLQIGMANSAD